MPFHNWPLFWVAVIAVVVCIAVYIGFQAKRVRPRLRGFFDLVRNPELWDDFEASSCQYEQIVAEAQSWDDETVEGAVCHFLFDVASSREAWSERQALCSIPRRTAPTVLKLLKDRSLYPRFVRPTGEFFLPESPFNRACVLLGDAPPAEAGPAVEPFLSDPGAQIRRDAASVLAKVGDSFAVPALRSALSYSDEHVRGAAVNSLLSTVKRDGRRENPLSALFDDVCLLLDDGLNSRDAAKLLLQLDRQRATKLFLATESFVAESSALPAVLQALVDHRIEVPRSQILSLIEDLRTGSIDYLRSQALGQALTLLGQQQDPEDRRLLEELRDDGDSRVAEGAAEGLVASWNLTDCWDRIEQSFWCIESVSMPPEYRYCQAVLACDGEVANGGLAQYFFNDSGNEWPDALAGFQALKSEPRERALRSAIGLFGPKGPATNRRQRQRQLSRLCRTSEEIFREYDTAFWNCPVSVRTLLARYVVANADLFRRMSERLS